MKPSDDFKLEALIDFPDDATTSPIPIGPSQIDAMMRRLAEIGVERVSWSYYADGRGGFLAPAFDAKYTNRILTYRALGGNPLAAAVEAAHRNGLEIYAYYKPYETGPSLVLPEGSYEATLYGRYRQVGGRITWLDPFVADNPHLRVKRKSDDLVPGMQDAPIHTIELRKSDPSPTRITCEHLQIWVSDLNCEYTPLAGSWSVDERVEPSTEDVIDLFTGERRVRKGDPQRILTIRDLSIEQPYVVVTTDFTDGTADFANTDLGMIKAFDRSGNEIPGEIASKTAIWCADRVSFRDWGLMFDTGYNGQTMYLDDPDRGGFVAFARGRNEYLPGALCETEPQVQEFWLSCLESILDTGVDGVDVREENHSTHTNHPDDYGYNDVVLEACRKRGSIDRATIAAVRGDAYTAFLGKVKRCVNARGKKMRINFQADWYRPDPSGRRKLAYPGNLEFQWRRWIDDRLTDEAILRFYALPFSCVFEDDMVQELTRRCTDKDIPLTVNRYIQPETLINEYKQVRDDGRFAGFVLYETYRFLSFTTDGACEVSLPEAESLAAIHNPQSDRDGPSHG